MKKITVKLDEYEVDIKKLPIGEYAELLKAIKRLPKHFQSIENLSNDKIIEILPEIIGDCLPDVVGLLSIATKLSPKKINELGLDEITKLVTGVFEVNNYSEVFKLIKKGLAHPTVKQLQPKKSTS